ncbi:MAG: tetratricopeptide repeat protein [Anaerolineae bacterium]|nr:MAG: tetratricopeptide repeat protein [Anaerolineae bacterium]
MTQEQNPTIRMIYKITQEIFDRSLRGEVHLETDTKALLRYIPIAEHFQDYQLIAQVYMTLGIVYWLYGHNRTGEDYLLKAFQTYQSQNYHFGMARCMNNLAHYLRLTGRDAESLEYCKRGFRIAEAGASDDYNIKRVKAYLQSNMASTFFAMENYEQAEHSALTCLDIIGEDTAASTTSYAVAKFILAEIYLHRQQIDLAWPLVNLAFEYASGTRDAVIIARTSFVQAHIAEKDPHSAYPLAHYYTQGREALSTERLAVTRARVCMEEARYQLRHGSVDHARKWAEEAHEIFVQVNSQEERIMAQAILSS